jgi:hypothetical protein
VLADRIDQAERRKPPALPAWLKWCSLAELRVLRDATRKFRAGDVIAEDVARVGTIQAAAEARARAGVDSNLIDGHVAFDEVGTKMTIRNAIGTMD